MTGQQSEYKAGVSFEIKGDHNIEWVKLTEQQILDKTIEYLNKYSNCFKNWKIQRSENKCLLIIATIEWDAGERYDSDEPKMCDRDIRECFPYLAHKNYLNSENYHWEKFEQDIVFYSEFRIAYNIIKEIFSTPPH